MYYFACLQQIWTREQDANNTGMQGQEKIAENWIIKPYFSFSPLFLYVTEYVLILISFCAAFRSIKPIALR